MYNGFRYDSSHCTASALFYGCCTRLQLTCFIFFRSVWPKATHLLCQWHCLQAIWRWLWNGTHNISKPDRPILMKMLRNLVYSMSLEELQKAETEFFENEITNKYPKFMHHINRSYLPRKEKWAMYVRNIMKLSTHSFNTSNFVESSFRVLKYLVLSRTKAYNLPELLDILFVDNNEHFEKKLIDIGKLMKN